MRPRPLDTLLLVAALALAGIFIRPPAATVAAQDTPAAVLSAESADAEEEKCEEEEAAERAAAAKLAARHRVVAARRHGKHIRDGRSIDVNADLVDRALDVARDINPATARRLQDLREKDPVAFQASMATTGRRLLGLAELKRRDRQLYKFKLSEFQYEQRVRATAQRLREARQAGSEAKAEIIEAQLRNELRMLVALSLPARTIYLKRLEEHIEKLRGEIDNMANGFDATVEDRYRKLMAMSDEPPS